MGKRTMTKKRQSDSFAYNSDIDKLCEEIEMASSARKKKTKKTPKNSKKLKFYAITVGRKTGIVNSWKECHKSTNGFPGNCFKGFESREEAEQYIDWYAKNEDIQEPNTSIHETVDVSCVDSDSDDSITMLKSVINHDENQNVPEVKAHDKRSMTAHHKVTTINQATSRPVSRGTCNHLELCEYELMLEDIEGKYINISRKYTKLETELSKNSIIFDQYKNAANEKENKLEGEINSLKDKNIALSLAIDDVRQQLSSIQEKWRNNLITTQTAMEIEAKSRQKAIAKEWKRDIDEVKHDIKVLKVPVETENRYACLYNEYDDASPQHTTDTATINLDEYNPGSRKEINNTIEVLQDKSEEIKVQLEPVNNHNNYDLTGQDVLMLGDSIIKHINPDIIYKGQNTRKICSYTIAEASTYIANAVNIDSVHLVILHVGSNDLLNNTGVNIDGISNQMDRLVHITKNKFQNAKIAVSSVLPRHRPNTDRVNSMSADFNMRTRINCDNMNDCTYVEHKKLSNSQFMYVDGVHIDSVGTRLLVADIKRTIHNNLSASRVYNYQMQDGSKPRQDQLNGQQRHGISKHQENNHFDNRIYYQKQGYQPTRDNNDNTLYYQRSRQEYEPNYDRHSNQYQMRKGSQQQYQENNKRQYPVHQEHRNYNQYQDLQERRDYNRYPDRQEHRDNFQYQDHQERRDYNQYQDRQERRVNQQYPERHERRDYSQYMDHQERRDNQQYTERQERRDTDQYQSNKYQHQEYVNRQQGQYRSGRY